MKTFIISLFIAAGIYTACTTAPVLHQEAPVPVEEETMIADWPSQQWSEYTAKALDDLGSQMIQTVPRDINSWCPGYSTKTKAERKKFWVMLISSLANFESSFNPNETYEEDFHDANGADVISRGLLQLSQESANQARYGCNIQRAEDLFDPETNIRCAVRIMDYWVPHDLVIQGYDHGNWLGVGRYWSPMRADSKIKKMQLKTKSVCV